MIKINEDKLIQMSVIGEIYSPGMSSPYRITANGELKVFPGTGGITYNFRIGDKACGWQADHVEPGVTLKNSNSDFNGALNILSCLGNTAKVVSGDAKGKTGYVVGKHGGCEHVLIDFEPEVLEELVIGDKVQIKAHGVGLELVDYPEIKVFNISPEILKKIPIKESKAQKNKLEIPVTHLIPAKIMGSGLGRDNVNRGDYDIQLFDEKAKKEYKLDDLRIGDFVAVIDADNSYGRIYKEGAVSIGVVVHSDCVIAGHGPGVMTVFSSKDGLIEPKISKNTNLRNYLYQNK
jgi:hypothetical protein